MKIPSSRLVPYAAAVGIESASKEFCSRYLRGKHLDVRIHSNDYISFGGAGLCYSDQNLMEAISSGFALPRIIPFLRNITNGFSSIRTLIRIKDILTSENLFVEKIAMLLRAGIASTAVFANFDSKSKDLLLENKNEILNFTVVDTNISFFLHNLNDGFWSVSSECPKQNSTAILSFADLFVVDQTLRGSIDHLSAVGFGLINVSGKIPLIDKIGFISRNVQKSIPSLQ